MDATNASQRMALQFRQRYRSAMNPDYVPYLHAGFVFSFGLGIMLFSATQLELSQPLGWLILLLALLVGNFGEYAIHRWLGHNKLGNGGLFYDRHTGDHHHFFVDSLMTCDSARDWRVLFFPPWLIVLVVITIALPGQWLINQFSEQTLGAFWSVGIVFTYLFYEIMHFSYHLPAGHWSESIPGYLTLKQRHIRHHNLALMHHANFNITLPLFDALLGSSDPHQTN